MTLKDKLVEFGNDENNLKKASIRFGPKGFVVLIHQDFEDMTTQEMQFIASYIFMYLGEHNRGIIEDDVTIIRRAYSLYHAFHNKYKDMKRLEEMGLDEFNKEMRKYDGRGNGQSD